MRILVVGCGYVGMPLAVELSRRGHQVFGVSRHAADVPADITLTLCDITREDQLARLRGDVDCVVNTVSSTKGGVEEYRAVYYEGTRNLLSRVRCGKFIFTSSSSVYAQNDGSIVTEQSAAEPSSPTSQVLRETEQLLLGSKVPAVILRVTGIYGPGRGFLFQHYLRGEARIHGDGGRFLNMIHRDDVVGAMLAAIDRGRAGEIYNVTDDEPVTERDFFAWLAKQLQRELPPRVSEGELISRKRGLTSKRVSNQKLRRELHYELIYPSFREGYAVEIARLHGTRAS